MDRQDRGNWHLNSSFQVTFAIISMFILMSFRLSVHQFFVGQKEITTNHFASKIQLFTKANFSEKDVWEFRPHRTRGTPWALKDRLHRLWKIGHPRWWYWWRFGISREWTCTDVRKVPSDCDVDDDDVDDDPIGPVKEKSRDIADFNIFDRDQEYNPFCIWRIQVQKKKKMTVTRGWQGSNLQPRG